MVKKKNGTAAKILLIGSVIAAAAAGIHVLVSHYLPALTREQLKKRHNVYGLLLGCAVHPDGTPSNSMLLRVNGAKKAEKEGLFDCLIISGGAVANEFVEAEAMADLLKDDIDVPILLETQARNTWENFANTASVIRDYPVVIITGRLHARRAAAIAKNFLNDFTVYPIDDFKWHRLRKELASRALYIRMELEKTLRRKAAQLENDGK